ncbi:MAG TPA: hypothetical protein VNA65_01295 [Candidatus Dormibacteraeota bacterium]|nr:hypothetical protein [Candidatus Dormibacteraeota bacterium]
MGVLAMMVMIAAACGASSAPAPASATGPAMIAVASNAKLGQILVDGNGRTLYLFEKDTSSSSTCYGDCAKYWPPLLTNGAPKAGAGATASLLGTTKRSDGTTEVTYAGHPLYYVVTVHNPGDATGQGVNNFGAPWDVVGPDGKAIG